MQMQKKIFTQKRISVHIKFLMTVSVTTNNSKQQKKTTPKNYHI